MRHVDQMIKSTPNIHPVVDLTKKFIRATITVLPQSIPGISNKSNAEDSETKSDVENSESITPVDTQQPRLQPALQNV